MIATIPSGRAMIVSALLAFAAGIYTPNANALAGALVPAEQRGRAIAIVNGGLTAPHE